MGKHCKNTDSFLMAFIYKQCFFFSHDLTMCKSYTVNRVKHFSLFCFICLFFYNIQEYKQNNKEHDFSILD